jgi:Tfp pilus assembly protein PilO
MKGSDKAIVLGVVMAIVLVAFYVKVLSPKREQASALSKDISTLQAKVDQQRQAVVFGEDARQHFPAYYGRLVVMGKAVPADADSSSLLVQLSSTANRTHVNFDALQLSANSAAAGTTPTPTPPTPPASSGTSGTTTGTTSTSTTSTTPSSTPATSGTTTPTAPATEATAASLPLGAAVGTAGLPTMPYDLNFRGTYFDVANFLKGVDDMVHLRGSGQVAADGRLLTINGFSLNLPDTPTGTNPALKVDMAVTSYVTPADQGLTAGAAPTGPSLSQPQTQPASATVSP